MRKLIPLWLAVAALAGCGSSSTSRPATRTEGSTTGALTTSASPQQVVLRIYLLREGRVAPVRRVVPTTEAVARAALDALAAGPTADDRASGLTTALSSADRITSLTVVDGVATIDIAHALAHQGLAQIVYTLTQFPSVRKVGFVRSLGGAGLTRGDLEDVTPPILVESPLPGDGATSPLRISGAADTFEARFQAEVRSAAGAALGHSTVTATAGSGTRGTFAASIPFTGATGRGELVVYESSAENGSRIHEVRIPLELR